MIRLGSNDDTVKLACQVRLGDGRLLLVFRSENAARYTRAMLALHLAKSLLAFKQWCGFDQ